MTPCARSYSASANDRTLRPISPIVPAPGSLPPTTNSTPLNSPFRNCTLSTFAMRTSILPVKPSKRMLGGAFFMTRFSCAAAASVRMLKDAPLSTVSGTDVPPMPTVATARDPIIFTGISNESTLQLADATSGVMAIIEPSAATRRMRVDHPAGPCSRMRDADAFARAADGVFARAMGMGHHPNVMRPASAHRPMRRALGCLTYIRDHIKRPETHPCSVTSCSAATI